MNTIPCPACNTTNPTTASVCSKCGASLSESIFQQELQHLKELGDRAIASHNPAPVMRSVNGTGTTLLNYRPLADGTYRATRWFTFFYLPLIPLSAWIVRPIQREGGAGRESYHYEILGQEKLSAANILSTYLLTALALGPVLFAFTHMDLVNRLVGSGPGMWVTLATIVWAIFLMTRVSNTGRAYKGKGA